VKGKITVLAADDVTPVQALWSRTCGGMSGDGRTIARSYLSLGDGIGQGGDDDAEGEHGADEKTGAETASAGVGHHPS
jgi:hypothetical protein